ncbi:hypothetical protein [Roseibium album]|uniref:hypothetical protein n=1 Tax=Roseibium album TaxID=311410 RepID=UPI003BB123EA
MKLVQKILAATGLVLAASTAHAAECLDMGGVAIPNFFSEGKGKPVVISATLMGTVTNAAGKILAQRVTETGLEMDMEHYFGRSDGGAIFTRDRGVLTEIPGKEGRYMIEITYEVQENMSRGTLEDYSGTFRSYGLVDLRDPDDLQGLVRYSGELCK